MLRRKMVGLVQCNLCGDRFGLPKGQKPTKIRCPECGSNQSLSVRTGKYIPLLLAHAPLRVVLTAEFGF